MNLRVPRNGVCVLRINNTCLSLMIVLEAVVVCRKHIASVGRIHEVTQLPSPQKRVDARLRNKPCAPRQSKL